MGVQLYTRRQQERQVPSHDIVASAWAKQTGKHKDGHRMFYRDNVIYSYGEHFPIAELYPDKPCVLFTTRKWSVSTAKHKSIVQRACIHNKLRMFYVPYPRARSITEHRANYASLVADAAELAGKSLRAVKHDEFYLELAKDRKQSAQHYEQTFKEELGFR